MLCCFTLTACWPARHKQTLPPPPQPATFPVQKAPPPKIAPPPEIVVPETPAQEPQEPPHFPKAQAAPPPAPKPKPVEPAVVVGPSPPQQPPEAARVPELAPLLPENELRAYRAAIDDLLDRASRNIAAARAQRLDDRRQAQLSQAIAFVAQAREIRERDPAGAKSLAERAELLSREVAGR